MAKEPTSPKNGSSATAQEPPPGTEGPPPQLRVVGQYIKDLSFESPNAPQSLRDPGDSPNIQVEINVAANQLEANIFECAIDFKVKAASAKMTIYNLEMVYAGAFELTNFPQQLLQPVLFVNCPALLFPFMRRLIGDLTREGGFPPLWLDPVDWGQLYNQRLAEEQGQAPTTG